MSNPTYEQLKKEILSSLPRHMGGPVTEAFIESVALVVSVRLDALSLQVAKLAADNGHDPERFGVPAHVVRAFKSGS